MSKLLDIECCTAEQRNENSFITRMKKAAKYSSEEGNHVLNQSVIRSNGAVSFLLNAKELSGVLAEQGQSRDRRKGMVIESPLSTAHVIN
ncbi:hypothetical protein C0J52_10814 [Blattella germanica]|nr:hypothetical protein C0J52_10814 [Blattella germanica]